LKRGTFKKDERESGQKKNAKRFNMVEILETGWGLGMLHGGKKRK